MAILIPGNSSGFYKFAGRTSAFENDEKRIYRLSQPCIGIRARPGEFSSPGTPAQPSPRWI